MKVNNSLIEKKETFSSFITKPAIKSRIQAMMSGETGNRFVTSIVSAVTNNPALAECEHMSIFNCAMLGESLKLSPSPQLGQFYMVPFGKKQKQGDKWVEGPKQAQFILGYKGYIQLAIRSGQYKKINILSIKEGELINWNPLTEDINVNLIEDELTREATPTMGYYAMFEYTNGFRKALYWSIEKMQIHADTYSGAFDFNAYRKLQAGEKILDDKGKDMSWKFSSFWYKDFDSMALKTMIRQLISKWGIMSTEMQQAIEADSEEQPQERQEPINITTDTPADDPLA